MTTPTPEKIQKRLGSLVANAIAFDGVVYRSSTPEYASASDLISGIGSKLRGQLWNPAGIAVVYASLTPEAAMMETLAHYVEGLLVPSAAARNGTNLLLFPDSLSIDSKVSVLGISK